FPRGRLEPPPRDPPRPQTKDCPRSNDQEEGGPEDGDQAHGHLRHGCTSFREVIFALCRAIRKLLGHLLEVTTPNLVALAVRVAHWCRCDTCVQEPHRLRMPSRRDVRPRHARATRQLT